MNKIKIEVIETISRVVEVNAFTIEEAIILAKELYQSEQIVLSSEDNVDVDFLEFTS